LIHLLFFFGSNDYENAIIFLNYYFYNIGDIPTIGMLKINNCSLTPYIPSLYFDFYLPEDFYIPDNTVFNLVYYEETCRKLFADFSLWKSNYTYCTPISIGTFGRVPNVSDPNWHTLTVTFGGVDYCPIKPFTSYDYLIIAAIIIGAILVFIAIIVILILKVPAIRRRFFKKKMRRTDKNTLSRTLSTRTISSRQLPRTTSTGQMPLRTPSTQLPRTTSTGQMPLRSLSTRQMPLRTPSTQLPSRGTQEEQLEPSSSD